MSKRNDKAVVDQLISISPRKNQTYTKDTQLVKEITKLHRRQTCEKLVGLIYSEVLRLKPKNVLDCILNDILKPGGAADALR